MVIIDSILTYIGIKHLGFIELWQSRILFEYYGLSLGLIVSTLFCLGVGGLMWFLLKVRYCEKAAYAGLALMLGIEVAATLNNSIMLLKYTF